MITLPSDLTVNVDDLKKRRLYVGYPAYANKCHVPFHQSMSGLLNLFDSYGIPFIERPVTNDALITRARNFLTNHFLNGTDFTNFMFIDSDIGFDPMHVLHLFALQDTEGPFDVIGAVYPRKTISWEMVEAAVKHGVPADQLHKYIGDFVFNPKVRGQEMELLKPSTVGELGTGFMMIRRETFSRLGAAHPEWRYKPDHMPWDKFDVSTEFSTAFWRDPIDPVSLRHMSEDYQFCQDVIAADMQVWVCPWVTLCHYGDYEFKGSLTETLTLSAKMHYTKEAAKNAKLKSDGEVGQGEAQERVGSERPA